MTERHDFRDEPQTAYLTYTTNQGWQVVCSVCDGSVEGHQDDVTDYAARQTYATYERR